GVEAERLPGPAQRPGDEVALVDHLERVVAHDVGAHRPAVGGGRGGVEGVEQLPERDRGRTRGAGALTGTGVQDEEVVLRGGDGVEEELAVLAAAVALPDARLPQEDVLAVLPGAAGEDAVVDAE